MPRCPPTSPPRNFAGFRDVAALPIVALRELAEAGDAEAQTELGERYEDGRGVMQDDAVAVSSAQSNRATRPDRPVSVGCTGTVAGCLRTMLKPSDGFAVRRIRATPTDRPISAGCPRTVGACSGAAWKRSDGIVVQRSRAIRGRRSNSIVFGESSCCGTRLTTRRGNRWRRKRPSMNGPFRVTVSAAPARRSPTTRCGPG